MLSKATNDRLTKVGPGTPMGNLMRHYWFPISASVELEENPVKKVRLLGEDLVLYKDKSGNLGLIDEPCPHRRVSMEYGIPEEEGLRCPYHGWLFNHEGRCLEQPAEPWNSTFKDRVTTKAYRAQELGGLVFAYMGPEPAPLLPRYDLFVWDNVIRHIGVTVVPCNWLQCMENSLDPVHVEWLHGHYLDYVWSLKGRPMPNNFGNHHKKIGFDRFEHGIIKRRVRAGSTEEDDMWSVGHPIVFPAMLRVGPTFQVRVPMDDDHTYHINYVVYRPGIPVPPQASVPVYDVPMFKEDNKFVIDYVLAQDMFAWASQGPIAQRQKEKLGQSDVGIIMYRDMLLEQMEKAERGIDPMEVYRDPAQNQVIELPMERNGVVNGLDDPQVAVYVGAQGVQTEEVFGATFKNLDSRMWTLHQEVEERKQRGESLLPVINPPVHPVGEMQHKAVTILP